MTSTSIVRSHVAAWHKGIGHSWMPRPRGLLVGESPGPNTDPRFPLFSDTSSAVRLMQYAAISVSDWLGKLVRVNLCDGPWSARRAVSGRARILEYLHDDANLHDGEPLRVLLLGVRVAHAWGCRGLFGHTHNLMMSSSGGERCIPLAWIPHPSGRNLVYNDRRNQLRAGRAVLWAIGNRDEP